MKYLLPLMIGCSQVPEECQPQLARTEQECQSASVIGENNNTELYRAINELKSCVGEEIKVVCSAPSRLTDNRLTIK